MENKKQSAFPEIFGSQNGSYSKGGLTKRELIAAMMAQGLFANSDTDRHKVEEIAKESMAMADELLTQLNKTL